uniref:Plectrovirus-related protein n=1 Tax=Spiroplasma citri TaxID=2133 RepID=Q14NA2_SPICI|nr:hypothetical protein SPICI06_061 [Spiroplasma citri]
MEKINIMIKCSKCGIPKRVHKVKNREKTEWFEDIYYSQY